MGKYKPVTMYVSDAEFAAIESARKVVNKSRAQFCYDIIKAEVFKDGVNQSGSNESNIS